MPRTPSRVAAIAAPLLLLASVLAVAACGTAAPSQLSQEQAEQAACAAMATLDGEIAELDDLDPATATVEDVETQEAAIKTSWAALRQALGSVNVADQSGLIAAEEAMEDDLEAIPDAASPGDALLATQAAMGQIKTVSVELQSGLDCATGGGGGGGGTSPSASTYRYDYQATRRDRVA